MTRMISIVVTLWLSMSAMAAVNPEVGLRDKIGQMLLMGVDGKTIHAKSPVVQMIKKDNIGGVILFDYDIRTHTFDKNIESPAQVKQLSNDLQRVAQEANFKYHRPQLPLFISVDYEGGKVTRLSEQYGFPVTQSAANIGKRGDNLAKAQAVVMAKTLREAGLNLNFAPVLDVNVNPDNPAIAKKERSFSSDASTVARYAGIYSRQFLFHHIQCGYKHFPGHGSSTKDSHLDFVDVTATWQPYELEPYRQLLSTKDACGVVMTAHIVNRQLDPAGVPATLSRTILTGFLRDQLHFKGVIITDDMQMKAISDHYGLDQALVLAINAGADMMIFGNNLTVAPQDPAQLIDLIEAKVKSGEISQERINDAYQHIVALKQSLR